MALDGRGQLLGAALVQHLVGLDVDPPWMAALAHGAQGLVAQHGVAPGHVPLGLDDPDLRIADRRGPARASRPPSGPTFTTTSSHTGRSERMLASTGKSSLIAFLTMVNPDTLTTAPLRALGELEAGRISSQARAAGQARRGRGCPGRAAASPRPSARARRSRGRYDARRRRSGGQLGVPEHAVDRPGPGGRVERRHEQAVAAGRHEVQVARRRPRRSPACRAPSPRAATGRSPRSGTAAAPGRADRRAAARRR